MNIQEELINRAGGRAYVLNMLDHNFESFWSDNNFESSKGGNIFEKLKYGVRLKDSGVMIIPPIYENPIYFIGGIAVVKKLGKYGAINKLGEVVIPIKYEELGGFYNGIARVKVSGKWGYINSQNMIAVPCQYENVGNYSEGVASVFENEIWCYINLNNKLSILPKNRYRWVGDFSEGYALVRNSYGYGFIDKKGDEVISTRFQEANSFKNGLAKVCINNKYGFINYNGDLVIPAKYYDACDFDSSGYAIVSIRKTLSRDIVTYNINKVGKIIKEKYRTEGEGREVIKNIWQVLKILGRFLGGN